MKTTYHWVLVNEINRVDVQAVLEYDKRKLRGILFTVFLENAIPSLLYFTDRNKRWPRHVIKKYLYAGQYDRVKVILSVALVLSKYVQEHQQISSMDLSKAEIPPGSVST